MSAFLDFFRRLLGLSPIAIEEEPKPPVRKPLKSIPKAPSKKADEPSGTGDGLSARERAEIIEKERKAKRLEKREARRKRKEERALRVSSRRSKKTKEEPTRNQTDDEDLGQQGAISDTPEIVSEQEPKEIENISAASDAERALEETAPEAVAEEPAPEAEEPAPEAVVDKSELRQ